MKIQVAESSSRLVLCFAHRAVEGICMREWLTQKGLRRNKRGHLATNWYDEGAKLREKMACVRVGGEKDMRRRYGSSGGMSGPFCFCR